MFYVYRHVRLDTYTPFYVGKGSGDRISRGGKNRNNYWRNISNKTKIKREVVKEFQDENDAYIFEKKLIELYKKYGFCEANLTLGGKGGTGKNLSEESRRRISEKLKGSKLSVKTIEKLKAKRKNRKPRLGQKQSISERRSKSLSVSKYKYCTPKGTFLVGKDAANIYSVSFNTILRWCKNNKPGFKLLTKEKNYV